MYSLTDSTNFSELSCQYCPAVANNAQLDADSDSVGDMCDPRFNDADSATVPDAIDNCPSIANLD